MVKSEANPRLGRFVETTAAGDAVRAFVPPQLPPKPPVDLLALVDHLILAERALGRLDGITLLIPSQDLFLVTAQVCLEHKKLDSRRQP